MKQTFVPMVSGQIRLRLLTADDLSMTLKWRNRDDVRVWLKSPQLLAFEAHKKWFNAYALRDSEYMFIIEELVTGAAIGQVGIYDINIKVREAEIGRFIASPDGAGRGLLKQGMKAMCDWALDPFGLDRVYCDIYADNTASIRACEWAGFHIIGRKDAFFVLERLAKTASRACAHNPSS